MLGEDPDPVPVAGAAGRGPHPAATAAANSEAARAFGGELQTGIMLPGKVRVWNETKGFGFITPEGGGPDVYANCEVLTDGDKLSRDLEVTFEAAWDERTGKYRATEVVGALVSQKEEEIEFEDNTNAENTGGEQ